MGYGVFKCKRGLYSDKRGLYSDKRALYEVHANQKVSNEDLSEYKRALNRKP